MISFFDFSIDVRTLLIKRHVMQNLLTLCKLKLLNPRNQEYESFICKKYTDVIFIDRLTLLL